MPLCNLKAIHIKTDLPVLKVANRVDALTDCKLCFLQSVVFFELAES